MRSWNIWQLLATGLLFCANVQAAETDEVLAALRKARPDVQWVQAATTPLPGVYEVAVTGGGTVFTDRFGRYVIAGLMTDLVEGRIVNTLLPKELMASMRGMVSNDPVPVDVKQLPLDGAIKFGTGKLKLVLFSDPDCPYCRQFEEALESAQDKVTVYLFPYPLRDLHPNATEKSVRVWCAKDRAKAWRDALADRPLPEPTNAKDRERCQAKVDAALAIGRAWALRGTPALIRMDGKVLSGAMPVQDVLAWLNSQ